jgi:hypothetical protein
MAAKTILGLKAKKAIVVAVETLFDRLKKRLLGPGARGKIMIFNFDKIPTLTGLFETASEQEGMSPRDEVLEGVLDVAGSYIDAHKEKTKARILREVQAAVTNASAVGKTIDTDKVLREQLLDVWTDVKRDVKTIVETEATIARNTSIFDAVGRIASITGQEDPVVFFITVRDQYCCDECKTIHIQPDGVTPRVWRMSEVQAGYHKKGVDAPSMGGLHPNCRCILTHLHLGYGFDASGRITYIEHGHDEFKAQRG